MLDRKYEPTKPYRFAQYGRMSDRTQNKRSPDQQFATIDETRNRCGYPWICLRTERDEGKSGRYLRKRPGLQRLLRDIETGLLQVDLIAVDTLERLGRAEEIVELRRKLAVEHGVLVVAADNNFADPTGVVGKAVGLVENIRSTEDGRIKAHNVVRGKKDAARLKHWPGGPPPFGCRLVPVVNDKVSPPEVYSVLDWDPRSAAALKLAFNRAAETGKGDLRMSKWWNNSPDIPDDFKPISAATMGYRLSNPIAIGVLRWGEKRTGIVNDTRVVEPNADGPELIAGFCAPLVSTELFERVQQLRRARAERIHACREAGNHDADGGAKLIAPQSRGLTLKYLLTGLSRCGTCNSSMRPVPSGRRSKAGTRYVYYACPRHMEGACDNDRYVPEDTLRAAVVGRIRARLFPLPEDVCQTPAWLPELLGLLRQEWRRFEQDEPNRAAADQHEMNELQQQLSGWAISLGNPSLPPSVRADIEARYHESKRRQQELLHTVSTREVRETHLGRFLDPKAVLTELQRLDEVLAAHNPTVGNLELSKHIDVILCYKDGRVQLRGTYVGLFAGAIEWLNRDGGSSPAAQMPTNGGGFAPVQPRRRGRLRIPTLSATGKQGLSDIDASLDPDRFAGLPESFVWTEVFMVDHKESWAEANAAEVARAREAGATMEELARRFGKTVPTMREALRHAREKDPSLTALPVKMARRRWEEDNASDVARLRAEGKTMKELVAHFGKSEPTIRKALLFATTRSSDSLEEAVSAI